MIYEHTCPYHAECSAVFDQKCMTSSYSPDLFPSSFVVTFFAAVSWMKKVLKGKHFADMEEVKQKMAESIKTDKFKNS